MLSEKEKEDILHELNNLKGEIGHIKDRLNKINKEKEIWFSQKEDFHKTILDRVSEIKGEKSKRNELTAKVRDLKVKRDDLNAKIKERIDELKVLEGSLSGMQGKDGSKENPVEIKKRIERLEFKIETEPMSFEKEKELMKEIKKLKKSYDGLKGVKDVLEKVDSKKKEIRELRKEATTYHKEVQESASKSQDHHEQLLGNSEEINALKAKEDEAYQKFFDQKQEFNKVNNELKDKLVRLKELKDNLEQNNIELEEETKANIKKVLEEKEKEVEEKVRKTKKLTTEDILILQAKEEAEEQRERRHRGHRRKEEHDHKEEKKEQDHKKEEHNKEEHKKEKKEEIAPEVKEAVADSGNSEA